MAFVPIHREGCGFVYILLKIRKWAYSKMVLCLHGMEEVGVRFPIGPQNILKYDDRESNGKRVGKTGVFPYGEVAENREVVRKSRSDFVRFPIGPHREQVLPNGKRNGKRMRMEPNKEFMREAIRQAKLAESGGDYAIGAVLVKNDEVISSCANRSKRDENPIAHAETLAIIEASERLGSRHLPDCVLYTTHEPCPMCASVAVWARLKGIVYGARIEDMKNYRAAMGNEHYLWRTIEIPCEEIIIKSTEKIEIIKDFMRDDCIALFHS